MFQCFKLEPNLSPFPYLPLKAAIITTLTQHAEQEVVGGHLVKNVEHLHMWFLSCAAEVTYRDPDLEMNHVHVFSGVSQLSIYCKYTGRAKRKMLPVSLP